MILTTLKNIEEYYKPIDSISYYNKNNCDAIWKYGTCLKFIKDKNIQSKNILDVGTGTSPLLLYLMKIWQSSSFTGIEIESRQKQNFNKLININNLRNVKMNYLVGDFLTIEINNKFDLIIDNCSIIHFKNTSINSYNDGLYEAGIKIKNLLSNDGLFIMNCDYNDNFEKGEYIKKENIIKTFIQSGLKYHEEYSLYDDEEIFKNDDKYNVVFLVFSNGM
jgi:SAM-dependent methyltransferase